MIQSVSPVNCLNGTLHLPPDKSIAQRAALFSLLAEQRSTISNYPLADDPVTALRCVEQLGARVEHKGSVVTVDGVGRQNICSPHQKIDCGNSGTVMRMLSGIIAGSGVPATLTGDPSLSSRPMKRIMDPLVKMGAVVESSAGGYPPLQIHRTEPFRPITFPLPVPSAQLKSCVLLAGLFGDSPTHVIESLRSRNHTEMMLRLPVKQEQQNHIIESSRAQVIPPQNLEIPGDFSAAAFWLVAASICKGSDMLLPATGVNPTRCAALHILRRMGANIGISNERNSGSEPIADIRVRYAPLKAVDIGPAEIPNAIDELPVLAVAMAFARGESRISGAEELRFKESDRLAAMEQMLTKAGVPVLSQKDGLIVTGDPDRRALAGTYESRHDHRIAMSAAIMSLCAEQVSEIHNAEAAAVSYPGFWEDLVSMSQF